MSIFGHRHHRDPIAVQHGQPSPFGAKTTIVLWRCQCKDLTTQRLEGEWTLGQVRGERELTRLERVEADLLVAAGRPGLAPQEHGR